MTFNIDVDTAAAGLRVVRLAGKLDVGVYAWVSEVLEDLERDEPRPRP